MMSGGSIKSRKVSTLQGLPSTLVPYRVKFQLKSGRDRRMVLTSVGRRGPWVRTRPPAEYPPLFSWQREGCREHAVGLEPAHGDSVGGWLASSQSTN